MRNQFEMDERAPLKRMLCLVRPFRLRSIAGACGCTFPPYKAALILRTISRKTAQTANGTYKRTTYKRSKHYEILANNPCCERLHISAFEDLDSKVGLDQLGAAALCPSPLCTASLVGYWYCIKELQAVEDLTTVNVKFVQTAMCLVKQLWHEMSDSMFTLKAHNLFDHCVLEEVELYGSPYVWSAAPFEFIHRILQVPHNQYVSYSNDRILNRFPLKVQLAAGYYVADNSEVAINTLTEDHRMMFYQHHRGMSSVKLYSRVVVNGKVFARIDWQRVCDTDTSSFCIRATEDGVTQIYSYGKLVLISFHESPGNENIAGAATWQPSTSRLKSPPTYAELRPFRPQNQDYAEDETSEIPALSSSYAGEVSGILSPETSMSSHYTTSLKCSDNAFWLSLADCEEEREREFKRLLKAKLNWVRISKSCIAKALEDVRGYCMCEGRLVPEVNGDEDGLRWADKKAMTPEAWRQLTLREAARLID
ncbi:unnamed protein product [Cylicocyclus nassatus]|uniref:Uncharacterized protein n=1 Tax=Cylicocyclus nassatus TaxID=53992 RepID=A0AA36M7D8_CYLNA|nr:unnamed protein product [Cylicocyclus nassatus]